MTRTPEQVAADDNLTDAIQRVLLAYHGDADEDRGPLMEYVVIASTALFDEEGSVTAITSIPRDDDVPIHRLLGLTEYASTRYRALIARDD